MRVADDLNDRIGGIRGRVCVVGKLTVFFLCGVSVSFVGSGPAAGRADCRFPSVSFCWANAHCVVDVFGGRTGASGGNECCVLRAGGGPVFVSIPLLLCDAGGLRPLLDSWTLDELLGG